MFTHRSVTINRLALSYLEAGDPGASDVLFLLHGFPLTAGIWRPQLERPPAGWRVIAPDLAGFGNSDLGPPEAVPSLDRFADDAVALLDELGISRAVVAGLSMGGYVVFALLRRAPDRVRAIALVDTRSGADSPEAREGRQRMIELVDTSGVDAVGEAMMPKLLGPTTMARDPGVAEEVRRVILGNGTAGVRAAIERLRDRPDSTPDLPQVTCPALVVVGEDDAITPVSESRAMAAALPHAHLEILPGAGHLSNLEAPAAFNAALARFLANLQ